MIMTINEAKAKLVAWCMEQVGYVEGANNWNKYAQKWTSAGGWNAQNQPWCDIFVDCGFIECFGIELASKLTYQQKGGFSALCSASAQFYKNNGAYYSRPEVGDQVFFNVSGGINHTGIVVSVSGGVVTTVEGNSSDINGYGRPNWSVFEDGGEEEPPAPDVPAQDTCSVTVTLPVVKYGDEGIAVKIMQSLLIAKGYSCGWWGADGDYGNGTKDALLRFQKNSALEQDGICGTQSWKKLLEV